MTNFGWEEPGRVDFFVRKQSSPIGRQIDGEFLDFVDIRSTWRCLDVGCGPGLLTVEMARRGIAATGADLSAAMIARAEQIAAEQGLTNTGFVRTPAEMMPFEDGEFDLALATNLIFLLPEPLLGLREMARVVRPGGWVATYQPSPEMSVEANQAYLARHGLDGFEAELLTGWGGAAERYQRFSVTETEQLYSNAGLVDVVTQPALQGLVLFARGRRPLPEESGEPPLEAAETGEVPAAATAPPVVSTGAAEPETV
ncbi:MAG TPA: class I SAM-dependent methyltransferase [Dehalococcoidia bacterium]|nr:class I SAM-dependent methyltransferase [Dehalococcoidia bacterium]